LKHAENQQNFLYFVWLIPKQVFCNRGLVALQVSHEAFAREPQAEVFTGLPIQRGESNMRS